MAKLIKFSQPNCRGCIVMDNVIEEVGTGTLGYSHVDISEEKFYVKEYELTGVPTMVILDDNGEEVKRHIGTMTEEEFEAWLK